MSLAEPVDDSVRVKVREDPVTERDLERERERESEDDSERDLVRVMDRVGVAVVTLTVRNAPTTLGSSV